MRGALAAIRRAAIQLLLEELDESGVRGLRDGTRATEGDDVLTPFVVLGFDGDAVREECGFELVVEHRIGARRETENTGAVRRVGPRGTVEVLAD
jgi:hypothetical protein